MEAPLHGLSRAELEAEVVRLRQFLGHTPVAMAFFDREMRYLAASRRWLADHGLRGDVVGRSHYEVSPEIGDDWRGVHRRCLDGAAEERGEDFFVRRDGTGQWLRWRVHPWHDAEGGVGGIVILTEDVTRRKEAERAIEEALLAAAEDRNRLGAILEELPVGESHLDGTTGSTPPLLDEHGKVTGSVPVGRDIADRKRMETALRQSEERFRILAAATFEGVAITENGVIVDGNDQLAGILGLGRDELLGRDVRSFVPADEGARVLPAVVDGLDSDLEHEMVRADGTRVTVEVHGKTVVHGGRSLRYTAIRDVTERKRAEATRGRLNRTLQAISESSQAMTHATNEAEYLEEVCRIVVEKCGHAMAWVGLAEDDPGKSVRAVAHSGAEAGYLGTLCLTWADEERGRGPTGTAIRTGTPALCTDMRADPAFDPWRRAALARGYASSIALPLRSPDRTIGALTIYSREPNALGDDEVALLSELAKDLSFGIETLRVRAAKDEATARLRESREQLRFLFETMAQGVVYQARDGRILEANPAARRTLGLTVSPQDEAISFDPRWRAVDGSGAALPAERHPAVAALASGRPVRDVEMGVLDPERGAYSWLVASAVPQYLPGEPEPWRVVVTFEDVTERRRAEKALRESEERYRILSSATFEGIAITEESRFVDCNDQFANLLGYRREDLLGRPVSLVLPAEEVPRVLPAIALGREANIEQQMLRADGTRAMVEAHGRTVVRGGRTLRFTAVRDISERKRAERALRESEERFRAAIDSIPSGFAIYDAAGRREYVNAWFRRATGLDRGEAAGRGPYHGQVEAAGALAAAVRRVLDRGRAETYDWEMPESLGGISVIVNLVPLFAEGGAVRQVLASLHDVTERRRKEAALERLNRTLKAISESNQAMVLAESQEEYLEKVCRIVVEGCGHAMAWIGEAEDDAAKSVRLLARAGEDAGYLDQLSISWAEDDRGGGPGGVAIRTGRPVVCADVRTDPRFAPWKAAALVRGYSSVIAVPLQRGGRTFGVLAIYSREANAFLDDEVALLTELASDLSFGMEGLRLREEKDRAMTRLGQGEARYRALVESSPSGVLVTRGGEVVYANAAFLEILGATDPGQVVGRSPFDFFHPDDRPPVGERIAFLEGGDGANSLTEVRIVGLDGKVRDVESIGTTFEDSEGTAYQVILRDITERKRYDRELRAALEQTRRREAEMSALLRAARAALESRSFEEAARAIVVACRETVGGASAALLLGAPGRPGTVACSDPPGNGRAVHSRDAEIRSSRDVRRDGPALLVPLALGAEVVGLLEVAEKEGGFSAGDEALAVAFAEMAAVALLNSRSLGLLETQVEERTRQLGVVNDALAAERARLFTLLDELPLYVFLSSPDRKIVFANRYLREHFGEPVGSSCLDLMGGRDGSCASCQAAAVLRNDRPASWSWSEPGGKALQIYLFPFRDPDGTRLVLEVGVDVTAIQRAYESEQRARRVADSLREAILALTSSLDLDTVLASLLRHAEELVPCDRTKAMVLERDGRLSSRAVREGGALSLLPQDGRTTFDPAGDPVIGEVLKTGRVLVIPDLASHPEWRSRPSATLESSWMGVPLVARGKMVGVFTLSRRAPGGFDDSEARLAEGLSAQASVAIENAILFEEVRQAQERTQTLSRRLVEVQEEERKAIARELHDETGQSLTSLLYGLRLVEREAGAAGTAGQLQELERTVQDVLENLHRMAANLRPASLDHLGLEAALRQHLAGVERNTGLTVRFRARGFDRDRLPPAVETTLYRVVQEALTNVTRHAGATAVDVLAERKGDRVSVLIEDDGVGFDPAETGRTTRLGLVGMKERAETLGGTFVLESAPGAGTTVVVEVPCADPNPDRR